jgi:hypothetical protein
LTSGDWAKVIQGKEPCPAARITSNAVNKGLSRENIPFKATTTMTILQHSSLSKKNELSQTKEVHKRQVVNAFGEQGLFKGSLNIKSHLPDGWRNAGHVSSKTKLPRRLAVDAFREQKACIRGV